MTMTLIETITVGSGGSSLLEFTNIPQEAGADLKLVLSSRGGNSLCQLRFNSDTATNYYNLRIRGSGSAVVSYSENYGEDSSAFNNGDPSTANTFASNSYYISNYTSTVDKSFSVDSVTEDNATTAYQNITAGRYATSSAITSIQLPNPTGSGYSEHTTASLYLVTPGDSGQLATAKATGGSISYAGGYFIHTFTSTGIFRPTEALTDCEYLVVAGGASGGAYVVSFGAGGGGAGGYRTSVVGATSGGGASAEARIGFAADTDYQVTIGAGGAQRASSGNGVGNNGNDSSLANSSTTITSIAGGAGGGESNAGVTGGSGGGGAGGYGTTPGGSGTSGQGYAGGSSTGQSGAGGGGAGAVGANQTGNSNGVNGGDGVSSSITNSAVARAGGGASGFYYGAPNTAGSGGTGGGGGTGIAGTVNTGGGGGGGSQSNAGTPILTGAAGGSGIVIVRYTA